jgi:hypothetical protein
MEISINYIVIVVILIAGIIWYAHRTKADTDIYKKIITKYVEPEGFSRDNKTKEKDFKKQVKFENI